MANKKCKHCGGTDIDVDPARGDAVCTSCGSVLEDSVIVSEVQFEENCHGGTSAIGHFVSADSHGGASGFGSSFHTGLGRESREITLSNAKRAITAVAQQLRLSQHCIDTAHNFYKMALMRNLTKGRKNTHVVAACLYITCRVEGTPHLLIDFSDVLQICVYELGRTYLRLSQALCINIPSMDPCLYILRFAHRLEFGEKTHEVSMTALRLVQRMKRDFIHTGRRPSGLCGAALLMAGRLHDFNRTVGDIVKIVKVHESTLRKRLLEFGDTPSSMLTLEEFMTVDLPEEQDPPSFKQSRIKDKKLEDMMQEESYASGLHELQRQIDKLLESKKGAKKRRESLIKVGRGCNEETEAESFIMESALNAAIHDCFDEDSTSSSVPDRGLGPNIASMGLATSMNDAPGQRKGSEPTTTDILEELDGEDALEGLDEDEIDSYIMTDGEAKYKDSLWNKVNANYLKEQKEKEEQAAKAKEEGKPEKKKRKVTRKSNKNDPIASTPGEAIEKMLQSKKISSKINYDVLRSLTAQDSENHKDKEKSEGEKRALELKPRVPRAAPATSSSRKNDSISRSLRTSQLSQLSDRSSKLSQTSKSTIMSSQSSIPSSQSSSQLSLSTAQSSQLSDWTEEQVMAPQNTVMSQDAVPSSVSVVEPIDDGDEDVEEEEEEEEADPNQVMSLAQMLNHNQDDDMYGDDYYEEY